MHEEVFTYKFFTYKFPSGSVFGRDCCKANMKYLNLAVSNILLNKIVIFKLQHYSIQAEKVTLDLTDITQADPKKK